MRVLDQCDNLVNLWNGLERKVLNSSFFESNQHQSEIGIVSQVLVLQQFLGNEFDQLLPIRVSKSSLWRDKVNLFHLLLLLLVLDVVFNQNQQCDRNDFILQVESLFIRGILRMRLVENLGDLLSAKVLGQHSHQLVVLLTEVNLLQYSQDDKQVDLEDEW